MAEPAPALADAIKNAESAMHTWGAEAILVSEKKLASALGLLLAALKEPAPAQSVVKDYLTTAPAPTREAATDLLHVIEWLETGHWMSCKPLFDGDGAKARAKGQRLRLLLAALDADRGEAEAALREIMAKVGRADECGRYDAVGDFHECDDQKPSEDWCSLCIARRYFARREEKGENRES